MPTLKQTIIHVCASRRRRGASAENIAAYLRHLALDVYKTSALSAWLLERAEITDKEHKGAL